MHAANANASPAASGRPPCKPQNASAVKKRTKALLFPCLKLLTAGSTTTKTETKRTPRPPVIFKWRSVVAVRAAVAATAKADKSVHRTKPTCAGKRSKG